LPGETWTAQVAVGELAIEQGDQPLARASFGRAARILHDLAVQIADPNMRRAFLSTPRARQALRAAEHHG